VQRGSIRILVGIIGCILVLVVLWEGFETMVLPRRVIRRLRVTRLFYHSTWLPWSRLAHRGFSGRPLDTILGVFGPLSLLFLIFFWVAIIVFGFALVHWAFGSEVFSADGGRSFGIDLYLSGTTFFTLGLGDVRPIGSAAKAMTVIEAGMGFGFLALVIGYFPALSQSFSRRESSISKLDSRAGSPPVGVLLLQGYNHKGGADELREQLMDWEQWSAELLESHLSYPVLAYYRSQHDHQSWLAALTAVMDMSALMLAGIEGVESRQAELTFAMARHAVVDIAAVFNLPPMRRTPERLDEEGFHALQGMLGSAGLGFTMVEQADQRLQRLRESYEPYIHTLADYFSLPLPPWIPDADRLADWQTSPWERSPVLRGEQLPRKPIRRRYRKQA
jgi:hypothetical protein